jgi:hypothetical protein
VQPTANAAATSVEANRIVLLCSAELRMLRNKGKVKRSF